MFGKFIFVVKHTIATIDVTSGERFWGLLNEVLPYLWFVGHGSVKPGFRQTVDRIMYPGRTEDFVTVAEVFY